MERSFRLSVRFQSSNVMSDYYHPDKVNHLGEELKKVAHEKTLEIKAAYEKLSKT